LKTKFGIPGNGVRVISGGEGLLMCYRMSEDIPELWNSGWNYSKLRRIWNLLEIWTRIWERLIVIISKLYNGIIDYLMRIDEFW